MLQEKLKQIDRDVFKAMKEMVKELPKELERRQANKEKKFKEKRYEEKHKRATKSIYDIMELERELKHREMRAEMKGIIDEPIKGKTAVNRPKMKRFRDEIKYSK